MSDTHDKSVIESGDLSVNIQRGDGGDGGGGNSSVGGNQLAILLGALLDCLLKHPTVYQPITRQPPLHPCLSTKKNNTYDDNNRRILESSQQIVFTAFLLHRLLHQSTFWKCQVNSSFAFLLASLLFLFGFAAAGGHKFNWCLAPQCLWPFFLNFFLRGHVVHGDCIAVLIRREAIDCGGEWCFNTLPLLPRIHWKEKWQSWGLIRLKLARSGRGAVSCCWVVGV